MQSSAEVVKGYTQAMRNRPDRKEVLKTFRKPILFIGGEKDSVVSPDSLKEQATICKESEVHILPQVAHMGMFESEEKTLKIISEFIRVHAVTT